MPAHQDPRDVAENLVNQCANHSSSQNLPEDIVDEAKEVPDNTKYPHHLRRTSTSTIYA